MIAGSFAKLIERDERAASHVHESVIKFLVYVEVKTGRLKRKRMTMQDLAEIEMDDSDEQPQRAG